MNHPQAEHDRIANELVAKWSMGKEHFDQVRNLMGFLAHAELLGDHHGRPTATGFIKGPKPEDWDLNALYEAAIHAHPQTRKKILAKLQKAQPQQQPAGRESVRDSINRAMTGTPVEKPKAEPVRDSIKRAMKG